MKIFNSLTRKPEDFKPLHDKIVTIYVCGITPYDTTHLGHAFTYISFDALVRYLKFKGYRVIYTQNVTDINDRDKDILERARKQNISWKKLSEFWTKKFLLNMNVLNWTPPTYYPKASEQIKPILEIIEKLLKNKQAYQINGSVYLDISKFPKYGKLSRFSKAKMFKVAKDFEEDLECPEKKNPLDITLWRAALASHITRGLIAQGSGNVNKHIPSFDSPFGPGRPGWHIECSAMSISTLGEQIDIHGGGKDLIFPHHEAEITQSEGATGKIPFAKYWLHTGTVYYRRQKMSKSKNNLVMISDLLKKYSPNAIRWLLLSHHWSKPWEYTEKDLILASENVKALENTLASQGEALEPNAIGQDLIEEFTVIMDQNLDTPLALQYLLKISKKNAKEAKNLYQTLGFLI